MGCTRRHLVNTTDRPCAVAMWRFLSNYSDHLFIILVHHITKRMSSAVSFDSDIYCESHVQMPRLAGSYLNFHTNTTPTPPFILARQLFSRWTWGYRFPISIFHLFQRTSGDTWHRVLPVTQPAVSMHWMELDALTLITEDHLLASSIHPCTPEGRSIAAFMPVLQHHDKLDDNQTQTTQDLYSSIAPNLGNNHINSFVAHCLATQLEEIEWIQVMNESNLVKTWLTANAVLVVDSCVQYCQCLNYVLQILTNHWHQTCNVIRNDKTVFHCHNPK